MMAIEVLLIDDDPDLSTMLRTLLRGQDFQIKSVLSSEEGIETVQNPEAAPDVVILDLLNKLTVLTAMKIQKEGKGKSLC